MQLVTYPLDRVDLKVRFARRMPDPVFRYGERYMFVCAVEDLPSGIPDTPDPREQNIDRGIYRDIERHLLNEMGEANTFHMKNKGITILASMVQKQRHLQDTYFIFLSDDEGIVDGAHTYDLIIRNQQTIAQRNKARPDAPIQQFVKVEVVTGIDKPLIPEIAGGLNTAVQVQQMSLVNLEGRFDWIKEELRGEPYLSEIAFRQGERRLYDVRDILALLDLFNVTEFPNEFSAELKHPIRAYNVKETVLKSYRQHSHHYERLRPILKDVLVLSETLSHDARNEYNKAGSRHGGQLKFVEGPGVYDFPFIGTTGEYRLYRGALFPMLGAFRCMVEEDPVTHMVRWRGGFANVRRVWEQTSLSLMEATKDTCKELGYNLLTRALKAKARNSFVIDAYR